jgi:hypothetical protein
MIEAERAAALTQVVVQAINTHYPHKPDHLVLDGTDDLAPHRVHPAFHGSYDWHSCVHMHWSLVRLLNHHPHLSAPVHTLNINLTAANIAEELRYAQHPNRSSFSRPYGWAWLLKLDAELRLCTHPAAGAWRDALQPLAAHFAEAFVAHLPKLTTPIRHGVHGNTAFACLFALHWARLAAHDALADCIVERTRTWFADDVAHGVFWEPSGTDFLSGTLTEAHLMSHVLSAGDFRDWFAGFMPVPLTETPLCTRLQVSDRQDAQIVHLDGLNLSRTWNARAITNALKFGDPQSEALFAIARQGLADSAAQVFEGDFVATHWLASFLLLAETENVDVL